MPRVIAAILLIAVLAIGGGLIATTAYQAGLSTAVTTATGGTGTVVAPVVVPAYGYGYGWHPFGFGFGFFGFLGTLFFLFIVFALIRAIFWRGGYGRRGGWGRGGWYGPGMSGPGGDDPGQVGRSPSRWESRAHETFDDWHRHAHDAPPGPTTNQPAAPGAGTTPADPNGPA
jgi:hypothetical protein